MQVLGTRLSELRPREATLFNTRNTQQSGDQADMSMQAQLRDGLKDDNRRPSLACRTAEEFKKKKKKRRMGGCWRGEGVGVTKKAEAARVRLDILSSYSNSLFVWSVVSVQHVHNGSQTEDRDGQLFLSLVVGQTGVQIYRPQGGGLGRAATHGSHRFVYSRLTESLVGGECADGGLQA